jgi:hypothetical protein
MVIKPLPGNSLSLNEYLQGILPETCPSVKEILATFSVMKDPALLPEYIICDVVSSQSSKTSKSSNPSKMKYAFDGFDDFDDTSTIPDIGSHFQ